MIAKNLVQNFFLHFLSIIIPLLFFTCTPEKNAEKAKSIALIGSDSITTEDLYRAIMGIPTPFRYEYKSEFALQDLVDQMIDWKLLAKEAEQIGLHKNEKIQEQLVVLSDNEKLKREQILASAYLEMKLNKLAPVEDEEIKAYYIKNQSDFTIPERVMIKRIFFKTAEEAKRALSKIRKGAAFEKFVQETKPEVKWDFLWLFKKDMKSEKEKIAFGLKKGEVSSILKTKGGFCILKVEVKEPERVKNFESCKEIIRIKLLDTKRKIFSEQIKQELRRSVDIIVNKDIVKSYHWE